MDIRGQIADAIADELRIRDKRTCPHDCRENNLCVACSCAARYANELADAILALEIKGRHVYPNRVKTIKCKRLGCAQSCEDRICEQRRPMTIRDLI